MTAHVEGVMSRVQPGMLAPRPSLARYLTLSFESYVEPGGVLRSLSDIVDGNRTVVGCGQSLVHGLGYSITGLETFPRYAGPGFDVPSTPSALWCWLRGDDRGEPATRTGRRIPRGRRPLRPPWCNKPATDSTARVLPPFSNVRLDLRALGL